MVISEIKNQKLKSKITKEILTALPEWFSIEKAISSYCYMVKSQLFFVAKEKTMIVGFISIKENNKYTAEIEVMGVLKEYQSKGIGRNLLEIAVKHLKRRKIKYLIVKTLAKSKKDKFYDKTRRFYIKQGFDPIIESDKIWNKNNPCVIMIKRIA